MSKIHYHICECGRWGCHNKNCNLSKHAKCGFVRANDYGVCLKKSGKARKPIESKFSFVATPNGYELFYLGKRFAKSGLSAVERKVKRNKREQATAQKRFEIQAKIAIDKVENHGFQYGKIWKKLVKIDKANREAVKVAQATAEAAIADTFIACA